MAGKKKGPNIFVNVFCATCGNKVAVTEFNKQNKKQQTVAADLVSKVAKKFCAKCRGHQPTKLKELKQ